MTQSQYRRVVLKLSGEAFADQTSGFGIDAVVVGRIAEEIAAAERDLGVEIAVVVGGGNIWRGTTGAGHGMDRATADYMGMLATVINALALQDALERHGQPTRVQSAIQMAEIADRSDLLLHTPASLAASLNLDVRVGHEVVAVDRTAQRVSVRRLAGHHHAPPDGLHRVALPARPARPCQPAVLGPDRAAGVRGGPGPGLLAPAPRLTIHRLDGTDQFGAFHAYLSLHHGHSRPGHAAPVCLMPLHGGTAVPPASGAGAPCPSRCAPAQYTGTATPAIAPVISP